MPYCLRACIIGRGMVLMSGVMCDVSVLDWQSYNETDISRTSIYNKYLTAMRRTADVPWELSKDNRMVGPSPGPYCQHAGACMTSCLSLMNTCHVTPHITGIRCWDLAFKVWTESVWGPNGNFLLYNRGGFLKFMNMSSCYLFALVIVTKCKNNMSKHELWISYSIKLSLIYFVFLYLEIH